MVDPQTFSQVKANSRKKNQSRGQGIVEYILLMVVVISIALIIMERLFKPMNAWMKNYIGEYVYCLLDQGELPSLGGTETTQDCDQGFKEFTLADGRAPKDGKGDKDGGKSSSKSKSSSGNSKSGSGGVSNRIQGGRSKSAIGSGFDNGSGKDQSGKQFDAGAASANSKNKGSKFYNVTSYGPKDSGQKATYNPIIGVLDREMEKIKKRESKVTSVGKAGKASGDGGGGFLSKNKIFATNPQKAQSSGPEIEEAKFEFGEMFRSLFIIVIIIVLALFIIGQLAQISKSMEKE